MEPNLQTPGDLKKFSRKGRKDYLLEARNLINMKAEDHSASPPSKEHANEEQREVVELIPALIGEGRNEIAKHRQEPHVGVALRVPKAIQRSWK